ncbi:MULTISPECIES: restriction endonuclease [unclassified Mesorhizobium]|uniref:restriction endonuclease n=1 Tax=unclassified Mesorhizobium TaxID=325217 RepID=UPI000ABACCEA|nr:MULTISPECIES: restriction endonuclease [unclassified Mesorhizobium]MBN9256746.1 restriction endonuclease [Mesorhizobium sp.]
MLNFQELPKDGILFELLIREILFTLGYHVTWSGVGPDGGRDLICHEDSGSIFGKVTTKWLIQCKHFANSGRAVGVNDIDSILDSCKQHSASGYCLISSTSVSSALIGRLEALSTPELRTGYWDATHVERLLSTPQNWAIAQRFMPVSAAESSWNISNTTEPNRFVANYKGYHFGLSNRIGSSARMHFGSIERRIEEMESIKLKDNHFLRIRAIWYNDKSNEYIYYIDYMFPNREETEYSSKDIEKSLGDGWALDDGQIYGFDVRKVMYLTASDHYDKDHYDYYVPYMGSFLVGDRRVKSGDEWTREWGWERKHVIKRDGKVVSAGRDGAFEKLISVFSKMPSMKVIRSQNSAIDYLSDLASSDDLSKPIKDFGINPDVMFSALIVFKSDDFSAVKRALSAFPQMVDRHIMLKRGEVFVPGEDDRAVYSGPGFFFLELGVHSYIHETPASVREALNSFFLEGAANLEKLLGSSI